MNTKDKERNGRPKGTAKYVIKYNKFREIHKWLRMIATLRRSGWLIPLRYQSYGLVDRKYLGMGKNQDNYHCVSYQ